VESILSGRTAAEINKLAPTADASAHPLVARLEHANGLLARDHEIDGILTALDARFVRPAPSGDLLATPEILPTGRNLHGFDPFRIPSAFAMKDGERQAARILERYLDDGNALP
jgi:magnesium chelatase subunit H